MDLFEFPGLADQLPPRDGYAARPIGRQRDRRPTPARLRRPSPTLVLLREIREILWRIERTVKAQTALHLDVCALAQRVLAELAVTSRERRDSRVTKALNR